MTPDTMTKDERSMLLYAESCCVDGGGLLVGQRMNEDDLTACKRFVAEGVMRFGRIPAKMIMGAGRETISGQPKKYEGATIPSGVTHWCELTEKGWVLAHHLRHERAQRRGPFATMVFDHDVTKEKMEAQAA